MSSTMEQKYKTTEMEGIEGVNLDHFQNGKNDEGGSGEVQYIYSSVGDGDMCSPTLKNGGRGQNYVIVPHAFCENFRKCFIYSIETEKVQYIKRFYLHNIEKET